MTTMTVTKVVLFAWLLSNHFSVADDSHELIKRVLPLNENCDPRVTSGDRVCVKGDWLDSSIADCERTTTLTCTPMNFVRFYSIVEPAVPNSNGDPGCISIAGKEINCDERSDTRCVCSSRDNLTNKCKCQYWPSAEPSNKPCIGYYLGQDTGASEWACCAESGCCMSHTWQRTTDSTMKCSTNGINIKSSARIKYYFSCGNCQRKWDCEMECYKKSGLIYTNGRWLDCFKDCCVTNSPQKKREASRCGDGTCSGNETSSSCPIDCCYLVNTACISYAGECTPQCCRNSKCCSGAVSAMPWYLPKLLLYLILIITFSCVC